MDITWLGHACFRLRGKERTVLIDPYDKSTGYTLGRPNADIVLITHDAPGHNNSAAVHGEPRIISSPGEYEIGGVSVIAVRTHRGDPNARNRERNVVFALQVDDLNICHLGGLDTKLTEEQLEALGNVDVLLVPVGGGDSLSAAHANEIVNMLEPKYIIPMHYKTEAETGEFEGVDRFLREIGAKEVEPQPKLSVTRQNLPEDQTVVLLDYRK